MIGLLVLFAGLFTFSLVIELAGSGIGGEETSPLGAALGSTNWSSPRVRWVVFETCGVFLFPVLLFALGYLRSQSKGFRASCAGLSLIALLFMLLVIGIGPVDLAECVLILPLALIELLWVILDGTPQSGGWWFQTNLFFLSGLFGLWTILWTGFLVIELLGLWRGSAWRAPWTNSV